MHEWLSPKPNPLLEVGKAVQFKALFNFQLRSWVTPEGRAQVLERMKLARDVAWVETPAAVAQIEISIADRPRRDALWAKVGNSWDRLCAGPLSGQALESYLTAVLVMQANRLRR